MQQSKWFPYLIVAAAAAASVLIAAGVPVAALLPFVFLLACPLMMVFMLRGMGGTHDGEDHTGQSHEHDPTRLAEPRARRNR